MSNAIKIFFFFKQKTAYEIVRLLKFRLVLFRSIGNPKSVGRSPLTSLHFSPALSVRITSQCFCKIGRASCRERVLMVVVAVLLDKNMILVNVLLLIVAVINSNNVP